MARRNAKTFTPHTQSTGTKTVTKSTARAKLAGR
jgi:hypothetical protein